MNSDICIDWISFSVKYTTSGSVASGVMAMVQKEFRQLGIKPELTKQGRKPYTHSFELAVGGRVYINPMEQKVDHYLVEITGRGCRRLYDTGELWILSEAIFRLAWNITRFDLAVDLETNTQPDVFASARAKRFRTTSEVKSSSGHTCYVGATKGDKYARVYRYFPPHERSHLLRIEMVYKKKTAREAFRFFLDNDPAVTAAVAGNTYDWSHPDWNFEARGKIRAWYPKQGKPSTLFWIRAQVIPAIRALDVDDAHPIWREIQDAIHDKYK